MKIEKLHDLIDIQNDYSTLIKETGTLKLRLEKIDQIVEFSNHWLKETVLGRELYKTLKSAVNGN